jgi:hypothetical protein
VIGAPVGVLGNLAASYLWEGPISRWRMRRRHRRGEKDSLSYLGETDHMYTVVSWNSARLLSQRNLRTVVEEVKPRLSLVDAARWREIYADLEERSDAHGPCGYVTSAGPIDWREGPSTQVFRVTVTPVDYSAGIATFTALADDPGRREHINNLLRDDPFGFIAQAPPSHLAINLGLLSADGKRFLGVKRSGAVATSPNVWTVGPCETFVLHTNRSPGSPPEDFFSLAERCLSEELGLSRDEYDRLSISWFGYYGPDAHPWITAQARTRLSDLEVKDRWNTSHSRPEASQIEWFRFDRENVASIVFGPRIAATRKDSTPTVEVPDGECVGSWIIHAPHALHEMWRMRSNLRD